MSAHDFISEMDAGHFERDLDVVFNTLPTEVKDEIGHILLERERVTIASKPAAAAHVDSNLL
jgi:hypothetical protein